MATKAPKTRHSGKSQILNFRVASGICQFNEGLEYLTKATGNRKRTVRASQEVKVDCEEKKTTEENKELDINKLIN